MLQGAGCCKRGMVYKMWHTRKVSHILVNHILVSQIAITAVRHAIHFCLT